VRGFVVVDAERLQRQRIQWLRHGVVVGSFGRKRLVVGGTLGKLRRERLLVR
jgi:hypothetical protein